MSQPVLELMSVSFAYPAGGTVLEGVDLEVWEKDFLIVTGPSGGGKTTFLRLLCCLENPIGGEIRYRGTPLRQLKAPELRRKVVYVQQVPAVLPSTVLENLLAPFSLKHNHLPEPSLERVREALNGVRLDEVSLDDAAEELSVGQRQRLCLIRTLLLEPDVLLLDEPLSALDATAANSVVSLLADANKRRGVTIVMISHTGGRTLPGNRYLQLVGKHISEGGELDWVR